MRKGKWCCKGTSVLLLFFSIFLIVIAGCVNNEKNDRKAIESGKYSNLLEARRQFQTKIIPNSFVAAGPADIPPKTELLLIHYKSEIGDLASYITPDPADGNRHPAIIWAHGGFGAIGSWLWEEAPEDNDQSVRTFLDAGIVVMCPSWRGENDNPGRFELFYGEIEDLLSALDYLKNLPYVDPNRIYLAGHSTGGTIALLGSAASDEFRAVFSFGGAPDINSIVSDGEGYGNTPFNYRVKKESLYRSPIAFVDMITSPTFYFEGEDSFYCRDALLMDSKGKRNNVPFKAFIIKNGTHFNILRPLNKMIIRKILNDTGTVCNIDIVESDIKLP